MLRNDPGLDSTTTAPLARHDAGIQHAFMLSDSHVRWDHLGIRYCTKIPISNVLAAAIISTFLRKYQPVLGFFEAGLFIEELVTSKLRFFSPFLVNTVLSYACIS